MVRPARPSEAVRRRVDALVGRTGTWSPVTGGYSAAGIWVVERGTRPSVFVKAATTEPTARFLREEYAVYAGLEAECMPELVAWDGDEPSPILVLEDLSTAFWPPPWNAERIDAVLAAAHELAGTPAPEWLPSWAGAEDEFRKWRVIADDPAGFIDAGIVSAAWLEHALAALVDLETGLDVAGDAVVHSDIRSDNVCLTPAAKLVDWNWTRRGDPEMDVLAWLPSLHLEGGPPPWHIRAEADPSVVAALAGYFGHYASLPPVADVDPGVRLLQRQQAEVCLDWLAHLGVVSPID